MTVSAFYRNSSMITSRIYLLNCRIKFCKFSTKRIQLRLLIIILLKQNILLHILRIAFPLGSRIQSSRRDVVIYANGFFGSRRNQSDSASMFEFSKMVFPNESYYLQGNIFVSTIHIFYGCQA